MKEIKFRLSGVMVAGALIKKNTKTVWVKAPNSFKWGFNRIIKRHNIRHNVKGI